MLLIALLSTLALPGGETRPVDQVELKNGKTVEGYVLLDTESKVVLRVGSRDQEYTSKEIANVRSANRTLAFLFERLDTLPSGDVAGRLDLARYCKANGLPGEADVLALGALALDPSNAAAHQFLEHVQRGQRWFVKRDNHNVEFDDLLEAQKDFRDPWLVHTTHYDVQASVALRDLVNVALDLERYYRATYTLLAPELTLYDVTEPMGVNVYADVKSYPAGAAGRVAYFDPQINIAYVCAAGGIDRDVYMHEATHQFLHNTAERARNARGEVPGWLSEGLAEYLGRASQGNPGCAKFQFGTPEEDHLAVHRTAPKPYDLGRILTMDSGDFAVNSKADLKYAQAYTLVLFCMDGDDAHYRPGFFAYLRNVYLGKSSMTDFKDSLGIRERDFEKAWSTYVGRKP